MDYAMKIGREDSVMKLDKVVLVKEFGDKITKVGKVYEIANILDNGYMIREASGARVAVGVVGFNDFNTYFKRQEDFKGWTEWMPLLGFDGQNDVFYRTNLKRVQVKFVKGNIKSEACCCPVNEFNLYYGIRLAYLRCCNKFLSKQKTELEQKLKEVNCEMTDIKKGIQKMINSLEV